MERLQKKFLTAARIAPQPIRTPAVPGDALRRDLFRLDQPRHGRSARPSRGRGPSRQCAARPFLPFSQAVEDFIHEHEKVFIVEQNRDGQLRSMVMNEFTLDARKLVPVLHYDGTPITARFIAGDIAKKLDQLKVVPFEKAAS